MTQRNPFRPALAIASVLLTGACLDASPPSRAALEDLFGEEVVLDRVERVHGRLYDLDIRPEQWGTLRSVKVRWVDGEWEIVDPSGTTARLRFL